MSKTIELTQGQVAIVDDGDYGWLSRHKWCYCRGYAVRNAARSGGKRRSIQMHRVILSTPSGMETDHINHDGLDNQRSNLRVCTGRQNDMNRQKQSECSSRYKGVCWEQVRNKWRARITVNGKRISLGNFADEHDAAAAYDSAAGEFFGAFANLNIIKEPEA